MHARRAIFRHAPATRATPSTGFGRLLRVVWATCLVVGLLMMANFGYGMWKGFSDQQHLNQVWAHQGWTYQIGSTRPAPKVVSASLKQPVDGVDFAIRIPKLGYFAAIREGVGSGVLYASPGHYPGTRWPGDPGTVGVAAHNVYWINFPQLVRGDEIYLETRYGVYRYRVAGTEIVNPDNRTALVTDSDGYHLT